MTKRIGREEGCFVGYSSGANVVAAIKLLKKLNDETANVVTLFCDSGFKYSDL